MGEMPDRTVFAQKDLKGALRPYLRLAQAIRVGDLVAFHVVVDQFSDVFKADKTYLSFLFCILFYILLYYFILFYSGKKTFKIRSTVHY